MKATTTQKKGKEPEPTASKAPAPARTGAPEGMPRYLQGAGALRGNDAGGTGGGQARAPASAAGAAAGNTASRASHLPRYLQGPVEAGLTAGASRPPESASPAPQPRTEPLHRIASEGVHDAEQPLPHLERIQASFGRHDVSGVSARVGGDAQAANERMGSLAYTVGERIGFRQEPDVRLAAHEAAHVVQQRRGVHLKGGVGTPGDAYESHADAVAQAVVEGRSAEPLLDTMAGGGQAATGVQLACGCGTCAACQGRQEELPVQHKLAVTASRQLESPVPVSHVERTAEAEEGAAGGRAKPREEEEKRGEKAKAAARGGTGAAAGGAETAAAPEASTAVPPGGTPAASEASTAAPPGGMLTESATTGAPGPGAPGAQEAMTPAQPTSGATPFRAASPPPRAAQAPPTERPQREPDPDEPPPPEPAPLETQPNARPEGPTAEESPAKSEAPGEEIARTAEQPGPAEQASSVIAGTEAEGGAAEGAELAVAGVEGAGAPEEAATPAASPMEAALGELEGRREAAVGAYEASTLGLEGASLRARRLAGEPVRFAPAEPGDAAGEALRAAAVSRASSFFETASSELGSTIDLVLGALPERIESSAEAMKGSIAAATEQQKEAISALVAQGRASARAQAASARVRIDAQHTAAVARIELETAKASVRIALDHATALRRINELETLQRQQVTAAYTRGQEQIRATGPRAGERAIAKGEEYATRYDRGHRRGSHAAGHEKDGFWDGYLTDRRAHARMNAARDVAKGYRDSLIKEADKQAVEAGKGLAKDLERVGTSAEVARTTLVQQRSAMLQALQTGRTQALASARATRMQLRGAVDQGLQGALAALAQQEASQRQAAADTGYLQQLSVEYLAHTAVASIGEAVVQATDAVGSALGSVRALLGGLAPPEPTVLERMLGPAARTVRASLDGLRGQVGSGAGTVEESLAGLGAGADAALAGVTTSTSEAVGASSEAFATQMAGLGQSAVTAFGAQSAAYATRAASLATTATTGFQAVSTGLDTSYRETRTALGTAFTDMARQLEQGLVDALAGMDSETEGVPKYAAEAAAREQPAWKSVVAVLLIIAIIVVVALVVGPFVIGAVGGMLGVGATSLTAMVVGGAIVGAATSATIQVINNWAQGASGWELTRGVGRAAILGAVGGAIGGAVGFYGNQLAQQLGQRFALSTLSQGALRLTIDTVGNVAVDLGVQLATGEFSWESLGMGLFVSLALSGGGFSRRVQGVQSRFTARGEAFGARFGPRAPTVTPRAPTVETAGPRPAEGAAPPQEGAAPAAAEGGGPRPQGEGPDVPPRTEVSGAPETSGAPRRTGHPDVPEVEEGIVSKMPASDDHQVKVTRDGRIVHCSDCAELRLRYKEELDANPDLRRRLDEAEALADPVLKNQRAVELEAELQGLGARRTAEAEPTARPTTTEAEPTARPTGEAEPTPTPAPAQEKLGPSGKRWDDPSMTVEEFIRDYRARYPGKRTQMTDAELRAHFESGKRLNPETGALKVPRYAPPPGFERTEPLPAPGTPEHEQWQAWQRGNADTVPCFPAGTPVKTPRGDVAIDTLAVGAQVYAFDPARGAVVSTVTSVHRNWAAELVLIDTPFARMHATLNHPYWVEDEKAWIRAGQLRPGMQLRLLGGSLARVRSVERVAAREATFNLTIAEQHTYYVSEAGFLVHNADPPQSAYASGTAYDIQIYRVIDRQTGRVLYVGQTDQTLDSRLYQHANKPESVLYLANEADRARFREIYTIERRARGSWTAYEAAVWEQHIMDAERANGATLLNRQEGIDPVKAEKFRNLHNPCR